MEQIFYMMDSWAFFIDGKLHVKVHSNVSGVSIQMIGETPPFFVVNNIQELNLGAYTSKGNMSQWDVAVSSIDKLLNSAFLYMLSRPMMDAKPSVEYTSDYSKK